MKRFLSDLVAGECATPEQVSIVVDRLMMGELDPIFAGAFFALQMRNGINGDQLRAGMDALMKHATIIELKDPDALDNCGTGGDGGTSFNVSTTAAFVIAGAGHTVAKHGNRAVSSSCGSADLLEVLGVNLALGTDQVRNCIDELGVGFMFAPVFHPAVRHAAPVRKALGIQTLFNMLGPLVNPAKVRCQLIGVFKEELTDIFAAALVKMGRTAYVVYGEDGSDEISLMTRTKITEVRDGHIHSWIFDPRRHGFELAHTEKLGGDIHANKAIFHKVLERGEKGPATDMVVLNAGFAMHTTGKYAELDDAFQAARNSIESGAAWEKVKKLIAWSQEQGGKNASEA